MYTEQPSFKSTEKQAGETERQITQDPEAEQAETKLEEQIQKEQSETEKQFKELIDEVNKRYENLPERMREDFIAHNKEILRGAIEIGMKNGFEEEDLKMLEMAAIWHDACKADAVPEEFKDVPNYTLLVHGEKAAKEIYDPKKENEQAYSSIVTDKMLEDAGFKNKDEFEKIRSDISKAILEHMGPHPGFMSDMLENGNKKLREIGKLEIKHPKAGGKISEALLAVDMRSLAGSAGRKKVLSIRSSVPFFREQDEQLSKEYAKYNIQLIREEAALMSGFNSAFQARDMISDEKNREWVNEAINDSMNVNYDSADEPEKKMKWAEISKKIEEFENAKKIEALRKVSPYENEKAA